MTDDVTRASKFLAYVLRHDPAAIGLTLGEAAGSASTRCSPAPRGMVVTWTPQLNDVAIGAGSYRVNPVRRASSARSVKTDRVT
jgi:hypothetical protein